jgi:hypothetical protein
MTSCSVEHKEQSPETQQSWILGLCLHISKNENIFFPSLTSPDEVDFFNLPIPLSRTMALGLTQPLTEMSTRNLPGGKERPAHKANNLTAICEPIV